MSLKSIILGAGFVLLLSFSARADQIMQPIVLPASDGDVKVGTLPIWPSDVNVPAVSVLPAIWPPIWPPFDSGIFPAFLIPR